MPKTNEVRLLPEGMQVEVKMYPASFFRIPTKRRALLLSMAARHWKKLNRFHHTQLKMPPIKFFEANKELGLSNSSVAAFNHRLVKLAPNKDLSLVVGHELCHGFLDLMKIEILTSAKANLKIAERGIEYAPYLYLAEKGMAKVRQLDAANSHGARFRAVMKVLGLKASRGMRCPYL